MDGSQPLDPRKTIFVGGVPRPLRAGTLSMYCCALMQLYLLPVVLSEQQLGRCLVISSWILKQYDNETSQTKELYSEPCIFPVSNINIRIHLIILSSILCNFTTCSTVLALLYAIQCVSVDASVWAYSGKCD